MSEVVDIQNKPFSTEDEWGYVSDENPPVNVNKAPSKDFIFI